MRIIFIDVDRCHDSPCKNNGTCHTGKNSFTCTCAAGFSGTSCETGEAYDNK